jgi:hypothetical protein
MAETNRDIHHKPASPPAAGEQDHDAMRVDAMLPVMPGTASTDTLAAAGGLNVPGNDPAATMQIARTMSTTAAHHEPIPGERDPSNLTHRQPGAMGVPFWGEDTHVDLDDTMTERTKEDREIEGGGGSR